MRYNIDQYIDSIIRDNRKYIIEGGYESVADYLIHYADNSDSGYYEYFSDNEKEFDLTDEQIEELKSYILSKYNYMIQ